MNDASPAPSSAGRDDRYPLSLRVLHWTRAALILGLIWAGWTMTSLPDEAPEKFALFYPNHKQFGVLAFILALLHLYLRFRHRAVLPASPAALKSWEVTLSHLVHRAIIALVLAVPLLGYGMSSTFTLSDGVPFFGLEIPELLPKNDDAFAVFQALHRYAAYTLLALVALHVAGALKHWLLDRGGDTDVLPRMM